jgi:hypothetical protein
MREDENIVGKRRLTGRIWRSKLNNHPRRRLNWKQMEPQGGFDVVKGVTHRVVVVKSPDKLFEEAIFVIRDDVLFGLGADKDKILKEARRIADSYVKGRNRIGKRFISKFPAPFFTAVGAAAAGVAWFALRLLGV